MVSWSDGRGSQGLEFSWVPGFSGTGLGFRGVGFEGSADMAIWSLLTGE